MVQTPTSNCSLWSNISNNSNRNNYNSSYNKNWVLDRVPGPSYVLRDSVVGVKVLRTPNDKLKEEGGSGGVVLSP